MRKKTLLPLGLVLVLLTQALLVVAASAPPPPRAEWTFMVYAAGDNSCEPYWSEGAQGVAPTLQLLESVGSTADVHFVALVDLLSVETTELIHIEQGYSTVVETYPDLNLGDPQVVIDFVNTVKQLYPAEKYLIGFWDHGWGWKGFCWDDVAVDYLDVSELAQIMDAVGFIDIVGFDACNMAQMDVYYALVGHATVAVGSEEYEEWEGWPYDANAQDLVDNPTQDALTYAAEMVVNWGEFYVPWKGPASQTFSAIDVSEIPALTTAFTDWTSEMLANLDQYKTKYTTALRGAEKMVGTYYFVDMYDYMLELLEESIPASLVTAAENIQIAINNTVVANFAEKAQNDCYGFSFYWAKAAYWTGPWSERDQYISEVAWGQVTGWADFLDAYHGVG